ncbi:Helicase IV [Caloramator mitchellensis]|uniref:Helicase IV n=1 Tax=Caloramator mitchellensis TaxID=908809 RepID=A0A0R3JVB9_CALMK|nr:RNA polymerase recycling motor HelD [Caloramator mitchellensis]KRQ87473.1 Helicase IV [Caloramator mitchellensis]
MSIKEHPDYNYESKWLSYMLDFARKYHEELMLKKALIDKKVDYTTKHINADASQDYIELMISTQFQASLEKKLEKIADAKEKPYFARVDFKENEALESEKIYIGKMSFIDDENKRVLVVDWRAPIANLYYEERLGSAKYSCVDGIINGEITLKRQYSIEDGNLINMFDIDITTNDEFLQAFLGASADNRLKEIVSTIQVEQNRIIRADMWKPLIVQGAAGSGKTTIALHRIAYLIYTYEKEFLPENFMIIAPSKFFLNYISEVLPELGVDKVKQTTFEEFAFDVLEKRYKLIDLNFKLSSIVELRSKNKDVENIIKSSEFKSSMYFKNAIDEYLKEIEENFIPKEDFKIANIVVYSYDEIQYLFINEYKDLPYLKRVDEIKKHLSNRLKLKVEEIINNIQTECDKKVILVKRKIEDSDERRKIISGLINKKDELIERVKASSKTAVKSYISKIKPLKVEQYYDCFMDSPKLYNLANSYADGLIEIIKSNHNKNKAQKVYEIEDLAALVYIKYVVFGMSEKIRVKHIVIDEAQDFSVFQLLMLKSIIKDSSFTILGDLAQGIHSYRGIKDWDEVSNIVFKDRCNLLTLEESYRTTIEIMNEANKVLRKINNPKLIPAKPVIRHGEDVKYEGYSSIEDIVKDIDKTVNELKIEGFKSFAVITKTLDECFRLNEIFSNSDNKPYILTGKEDEYRGGFVMLPSYLAKGLEFDAVFISNANDELYKDDELDAKLLYVAMTRPLHVLKIYYTDKITPLLKL